METQAYEFTFLNQLFRYFVVKFAYNVLGNTIGQFTWTNIYDTRLKNWDRLLNNFNAYL